MSPHTADCIIEAWGPDRASCLTEALTALVETFALVPGTPATESLALASEPGDPEDALVCLLEEVIYNLDVRSVVPVGFRLAEIEGGRVAGSMDVVPVDAVKSIGPVPKAVSYSGLSMTPDDGGWRCRVLVDV
jgi:SHS2 domain-containing protein